jgi:hypothetical protein
MRDRAKQKKEEQILLYQVFCEGAKTQEQRLLGVRSAQFVERSLELMNLSFLRCKSDFFRG